jgi:hypothetical protein
MIINLYSQNLCAQKKPNVYPSKQHVSLFTTTTAPELLSIFYQASSTTRNYGIAEGLFLCGLNKF